MYTIKKLADIANISIRTLRYYDEIELHCPTALSESGYRLYDENAIDLFQHILFYKTLGLQLNEIKEILYTEEFDSRAALIKHKEQLLEENKRIETLIDTVTKSIQAMEGQYIMTDQEKFNGFKEALIEKNEKKYGKEARELFGNQVDASNEKIRQMDQETMENLETFTHEMNEKFKEAMMLKDPNSSLAKEACGMHEKWIKQYWDFYSKKAHLGLVTMYVEDERFKSYYDQIEKDLAYFIKAARTEYLK